MSLENHLNQYVQSLQNLPSFNVWKINDDGSIEPWWEIKGEDIAKELVIFEQYLGYQVQTVTGEIQRWHRLEAQCRRVWQITEHNYRVWRDGFCLDLIDPEGKPEGWKKPTEKEQDRRVRTDPEYLVHYHAQERAEEAVNACHGIVKAYQVKADLLRAYARRTRDGAAVYLDV